MLLIFIKKHIYTYASHPWMHVKSPGNLVKKLWQGLNLRNPGRTTLRWIPRSLFGKTLQGLEPLVYMLAFLCRLLLLLY